MLRAALLRMALSRSRVERSRIEERSLAAVNVTHAELQLDQECLHVALSQHERLARWIV